MTQSAESSWAERLTEANFCSFDRKECLDAKLSQENRRFVRFMHEEPVVLETQSGERVGAVVMNYSQEGLYFESDVAIDKGAIIRIRNGSAPTGENPQGCRAEIRWSRPLRENGGAFRFGTGARYC